MTDPGADWDAAMRRGDDEAAWAVNDAVLAGRDRATRDDPHRPYHQRWVWDGRPMHGQQVVVRCYHGLGDTLMFARFLPALRAVAARVTLEVQAPLAEVLAGYADAVVPFDPARPIPPGEVDVEIMELSHALRQAPCGRAYLKAPGGAARGVGLCWAGGGWDAARDMPAVALRPLLPGRRAVSLQRGPAAADAAALGIIDPLDGDMDIGRLATLVAGLDAVVTVDTMVAHLAGAMGIPVFMMLKQEADWRWETGERTRWYGSARLFRQQAPGDWAGIVGELCLCLPLIPSWRR